jgi:carboxyl-terminal processing protease
VSLLGFVFLGPGRVLVTVSPAQTEGAARNASETCSLAQEVTEVVLRQHIDPPTRQQMILSGLKRLYQVAGLTHPANLSRRISLAATPEQFSTLIKELWPAPSLTRLPAERLGEAFTEGLLSCVPGGAELSSAKEYKVQEQLHGNRYVGIHIQLGYDAKTKQSVIQAIVPGGPADRAGAKEGDRIEAVNGADTKDLKIAQVVDRLRGPEGTEVVVKVRQPNARESRTLRMIRGVLFLPTVSGARKRSSGEWDYHIGGTDPIAYLRVREVSASTPHELRKVARELESQGFEALVLDLRGLSSPALHATVLLADTLLSHGKIGQVRLADRVMTYDATDGALFQNWPFAVLVDSNTGAGAEWLAAALQDNRRAVIVGSRTKSGQPAPRSMQWLNASRPADIHSSVPVMDGHLFLSLVTGRFERGDGRPLCTSPVRSTTPENTRPELTREVDTANLGGVKPDYSVGSRGQRVGARPPTSDSMFTQDMPLEPGNDPCLLKAIEVLRGALNTA